MRLGIHPRQGKLGPGHQRKQFKGLSIRCNGDGRRTDPPVLST